MNSEWKVDEQGWPSNRDQRTVEQIKEARFHARLQGMERGWAGGSFPALSNAVKLCGEYGRPLPRWAEEGVQRTLADQFHGRRSNGHGRSSNPKAAHRDNMLHLERWSEVDYLRNNWQYIHDPYDEGTPHFVPMKKRPTLEEAYELVAHILKGRQAEGTAEAIKKSYRKVERARRQGDDGAFWV